MKKGFNLQEPLDIIPGYDPSLLKKIVIEDYDLKEGEGVKLDVDELWK